MVQLFITLGNILPSHLFEGLPLVVFFFSYGLIQDLQLVLALCSIKANVSSYHPIE